MEETRGDRKKHSIDKKKDKEMIGLDEEWRGSECLEEKHRDQSPARKAVDRANGALNWVVSPQGLAVTLRTQRTGKLLFSLCQELFCHSFGLDKWCLGGKCLRGASTDLRASVVTQLAELNWPQVLGALCVTQLSKIHTTVNRSVFFRL